MAAAEQGDTPLDISAYVQPSTSTGLGVDIVEIERMERIIERTPRFPKRVFSEAERAYCESHHRPAVRYATHFAAKEAVLKALGTGFSQGIGYTDVEVAHDEQGKPLTVLHGRAKEIAEERGIVEIPLSLSRTRDTAVANAIAITAVSRPQVVEKTTPSQEIAARFKELRSMLDDLEHGHSSLADEAAAEGASDANTGDDNSGGEDE